MRDLQKNMMDIQYKALILTITHHHPHPHHFVSTDQARHYDGEGLGSHNTL